MKIKVEEIKKKYHIIGGKRVLTNISFEAQSGECIGILGTNGCGKTTLLSILAGINKADSGKFFIDDVNVFNKRKIIEDKIGYVPQGNPLMEELSARDNLRLWYTGSRLDMNKELKDGVLKMLGIDAFLHTKVSRMSGGMKKRLSIGCAIANDPSILILDEPGASLDLLCRENIDTYLRHFKSQGGIIIITTHESREIELCDKTFVIKNGEMCQFSYEGVEPLLTLLNNN